MTMGKLGNGFPHLLLVHKKTMRGKGMNMEENMNAHPMTKW